MGKEIYLDGAANTPLSRSVLRAMKPFLNTRFVGNSMSVHNLGSVADMAVTNARSKAAQAMAVPANQVYFTSGATESNNWVIKALATHQLHSRSYKNQILCSATEHASVLKCCEQVSDLGLETIFIHPSNGKNIRLIDLKKINLDRVFLICTMAINNETGVSNDIADITSFAKRHGIPTLVDCTQLVSFGGRYMELGTMYPNASYMTFSGHKIYGPTGTGCLIARDSFLLKSPLIIGGAQENGLRGGTSNVAGIVGLSQAITDMRKHSYEGHFNELLSFLRAELDRNSLKDVYYNAIPSHSNIVSLDFSKVMDMPIALAQVLASYNICVSAGSACDSKHGAPSDKFKGSHVLLELGLTEKEIKNTVRVSFTKDTTKKDIVRFVKTIKGVIKNGF